MSLQELEKTQATAAQNASLEIQNNEINLTAPGKLRVIKRNGKVVPFEEDKIKVAITKAFLANESVMLLQVRGSTSKSKTLPLM